MCKLFQSTINVERFWMGQHETTTHLIMLKFFFVFARSPKSLRCVLLWVFVHHLKTYVVHKQFYIHVFNFLKAQGKRNCEIYFLSFSSASWAGPKLQKIAKIKENSFSFTHVGKKIECMALLSIKPFTKIVKFIIFGMPRPVGLLFFFSRISI